MLRRNICSKHRINRENYLSILNNNDYFGININLTEEDISRNDMYKQETTWEETKGNFLTNEEFQKIFKYKNSNI